MVNKTLIRPYFWGGTLGGGRLTSHEKNGLSDVGGGLVDYRHEFEATGTTEFHQSHLFEYLMNSRTFWQKMIFSNYGHQNLWYLRHVFQALNMT